MSPPHQKPDLEGSHQLGPHPLSSPRVASAGRPALARTAGLATSVARAVSTGISWVLVGMIRAYQLLISPLLGPTCKYYPSCSSYAIQALRLRGPIVGLWLLASRLARCNPWSLGGVDDVPLPRGADSARHRCHTLDRPTEQRSRSMNE